MNTRISLRRDWHIVMGVSLGLCILVSGVYFATKTSIPHVVILTVIGWMLAMMMTHSRAAGLVVLGVFLILAGLMAIFVGSDVLVPLNEMADEFSPVAAMLALLLVAPGGIAFAAGLRAASRSREAAIAFHRHLGLLAPTGAMLLRPLTEEDRREAISALRSNDPKSRGRSAALLARDGTKDALVALVNCLMDASRPSPPEHVVSASLSVLTGAPVPKVGMLGLLFGVGGATGRFWRQWWNENSESIVQLQEGVGVRQSDGATKVLGAASPRSLATLQAKPDPSAATAEAPGRNSSLALSRNTVAGEHRFIGLGRLWRMIGIALLIGTCIGIVPAVLGPKKLHLMFLFVGSVSVVAAVFGIAAAYRRAAKRREDGIARVEGRKWSLRDDWERKEVKADFPGEVIAPWPVLALLAGAAAVMLRVGIKDSLIEQLVRALGYLAATMFLVVLAWGVVALLRFITHARPVLRIPRLPLVPDATHHCQLLTKAHCTGPGTARATLTCTQITGVGNQARVDKLHEETTETDLADAQVGEEGTTATISVAVPGDLPDREDDYCPLVHWTLLVESDAFPRRLKATFQLPVYREVESPSP